MSNVDRIETFNANVTQRKGKSAKQEHDSTTNTDDDAKSKRPKSKHKDFLYQRIMLTPSSSVIQMAQAYLVKHICSLTFLFWSYIHVYIYIY